MVRELILLGQASTRSTPIPIPIPAIKAQAIVKYHISLLTSP